jgi:mRNA-degrading endonuclease RelE of RelBE toxin-antitoxin system
LEIYKSLSKIRKNPYRAKKLFHEHEDSFRVRVRTYRIIYQIENDEIIVLTIGHRKNVYNVLLFMD